MLDRIQLKREAKGIVRGAQVSAYLFTLMYLAIIYVLTGIDTYSNGSIVNSIEAYFPEMQVPAFLQHNIAPAVVMFISVMVMLLSAVLNAGYALYHLGIRRGETMSYTTLFDGFSFVGKVILLELMVTISVTLWTFLFIIPGFIAAYRLRFAIYNLCENPEMGVMEAMNMSAAQTRGYKMDLFVLDVTFIGWRMLSFLTLGVLDIWVTPYMAQTNVGYFQQIKKMKGIGWFPPAADSDDSGFRAQDPFGPNK